MPQPRRVRLPPRSLVSLRVRRGARELLLGEQGEMPDVLSHYTGAAGALGIIKSGTVRATDALFMNDASELRLARDIFESKLNRWLGQNIKLKSNRQRFAEAFWEAFLGGALAEEPLYIACFCAESDLLSQWRAYAQSGGGYEIQFDGPRLGDWAGEDVELFSVIYDTDRHLRLARQLVVDGINIAKVVRTTERVRRPALYSAAGSTTGEMARTFAYRVKHHSFAEEKEWRLVYQDPLSSPLGDETIPKPREFRTGARGIVPYVGIDFAVENANDPDDYGEDERWTDLPLKAVRVGPTAHHQLSERALRYLLDDCGYEAPVEKSSIPLRA